MPPKTRTVHPLPGYLHPMPPGTYAGTERPILLMAACPCGKWHTHGAGTVQRPMDYWPGMVVGRASHCLTFDYREIQIRPEPFRVSWSTPRSRISTVYRRWPGSVTATRPDNADG